MDNSTSNTNAFTLIELLVVISIISLLSSVVLSSLSNARASARNSKRRQDLNQIRTALEMFYNDKGHYPKTGGLDNVHGDPTCQFNHSSDTTGKKWIPGLVSGGYMNSLPQDPQGQDEARNADDRGACYAYSGNGQKYVLSAWATIEAGKVSKDDPLYSRAGYRETNLMVDNAAYYCDHPNIGNPNYGGDYYRYSYTITANVNCNW